MDMAGYAIGPVRRSFAPWTIRPPSRFIEFENVTKTLRRFRRRRRSVARHLRARVLRAARAVGLRQDDADAHARRLRRADQGRCCSTGRTSSASRPTSGPTNMMFQSYALFPHMSVWDNIAFGLKQDGMPKAEIADARRGDADAGQARAIRQAQAAPAFRRPAPARGARPLARQEAEGAAARRAARRARQEAARGDPVRADRSAGQARHDLPDRHPRPGRGDDGGRPHRRDGPGQASSRSRRRPRSTSSRIRATSPTSSATSICSRARVAVARRAAPRLECVGDRRDGRDRRRI